MVRRFVYDAAADRVVEVPAPALSPRPTDRYDDALGAYREDTSGSAGKVLREAALERAGRREFAHRRLLDEWRWTET